MVPNDQFLLYVFDGAPEVSAGLEDLRANARRCDELRLRVRDDCRWSYPHWVSGDVRDEQFVVHEAIANGDWRACLDSVAQLDQLDVTEMTWRVHVYPPEIVVVQMSHALGDGTRSAELAAALLGRKAPVAGVRADRGRLLPRAVRAARAHRDMVRDTDIGMLHAPPAPRPALSINARAETTSIMRTLVFDRDDLRHPTVTVAALVAIGEALGGYLADRGEDVSRLGAEVPVAGSRPATARNNFRNVNVGLYPELDARQRSQRIAAELSAARRRADHPAAAASAAASAAVPAVLLRWGMRQFDPGARSATVSGHTVVSSVNRGPADLTFGGCRVRFSAGYPALSPMMGLTHGVHGIGDTVALSVHADPSVIDLDEYLDRLTRALPMTDPL